MGIFRFQFESQFDEFYVLRARYKIASFHHDTSAVHSVLCIDITKPVFFFFNNISLLSDYEKYIGNQSSLIV